MQNNMSKYIISLLVLLGSFFSFNIQAQDFHLSQHREAALYMNPALTGTYTGIYQDEDSDYRIALDTRSQWGALGIKPYNTAYLGYDMKYERFGIGAYLINNQSGSGNINMLQFQVSGNYNIIERDEPHILTAGLQLGLFNKSFNPQEFTYHNQYSSALGGFDANAQSGEAFGKTNKLNFDANIGAFYKYNEDDNMAKPYIGVSTYHLTMPNESFYSEKQRIPMRWVVSAGSDLEINEEFYIQPDLLFMYQGGAREILFNANTKYVFDDTYSVLFGAGYRFSDALVFNIGLKHKRNILKFSYDINTSFLNEYTGGRGAMELTIVLLGKKGEPLFEPKF